MNYDVLRAAREASGRTQSELARAIGSHQSVISDLERGRGDPPVSLLLELLAQLDLQPMALFPTADPPDERHEPAYTIAARVAHAFLRHRHQGLGEIFQVLVEDLRRLRIDLLAVTLHLFDRRPMSYAGAIAGRWGPTWRENVFTDSTSHLRDTRGELYRGWRNQTEVRKDGQLCTMPDYEPALVVDQPVPQGMVGFGFAHERPDISPWTRLVADAVSEGVGLLDEIRQASSPNLAGEVLELKSRLDRLEARLAPDGSGED